MEGRQHAVVGGALSHADLFVGRRIKIGIKIVVVLGRNIPATRKVLHRGIMPQVIEQGIVSRCCRLRVAIGKIQRNDQHMLLVETKRGGSHMRDLTAQDDGDPDKDGREHKLQRDKTIPGEVFLPVPGDAALYGIRRTQGPEVKSGQAAGKYDDCQPAAYKDTDKRVIMTDINGDRAKLILENIVDGGHEETAE